MSPFNNSNFEDLVLRTLMGRLQIQSPTDSFLSQSLQDLLTAPENLSDKDDDVDGIQSRLRKEETKLENEIIRIIVSGRSDTLKPNSGQAVTINEHYICVSYQEEEEEADYRVWEWHGHIMMYDDENGFSPEYIYGNYFERLPLRLPRENKEEDKKKKDDDEKVENLGLRELIGGGDSDRGRIVHRNVNPSPPSV